MSPEEKERLKKREEKKRIALIKKGQRSLIK